MSQRTKANMISTINTILTTNGVGDITGAKMNSICQDLADSLVFWDGQVDDDDTLATDSDDLIPTQAAVKAYVDSQSSDILSCDETILTAAILTGNATPVELIAAPGAGKIIFVIGNVLIKYIYSGAAFATNTNIEILHGGSVTSQLMGNPLANTANYYGVVTSTYGGLASSVENQAVNFKVATGNPTGGGTSSVKISFKYVILTL
jgi:hypothetical protein